MAALIAGQLKVKNHKNMRTAKQGEKSKRHSIPRYNIPRHHSLNLQHHLWDRESGLIRRNWRCKSPGWQYLHERQFYRSITPNLSVANVTKPNCYIRKFTPDGRYLLCFSFDQRTLEVYTFKGVAYSGCLLHGIKDEFITAYDRSFSPLYLRQRIFMKLFNIHMEINVVPDTMRCMLNREFSIFLDDGLYVLLGATSMSMELPPAAHMISYPDWLDDSDMYCYTFFLINLKTGTVSDQLTLPRDNIMLSHNHGVSAYDHTIVILSKCRQCIEIIQLVDGKLQRLYEVGPHPDAILEASVRQITDTDDSEPNPLGKLPLSYIKQRILVYLYNEVIAQPGNVETQRKNLLKFYREFDVLERMLMIKVQLIDSDTLLIRYEKRPQIFPIAVPNEDPPEFRLYVFYCLMRKCVLKVYRNDSVELLYLMRNFYDNFRNVHSTRDGRHSSSPSNDEYFRFAFDSAIKRAYDNAAKNLNPTLPISTQSYTTSLYLDYSLYIYDDRLISQLERPKINHMNPITFRDRLTQTVAFRFYLEAGTVIHDTRELVAFVFHPFEPFVISIQKLATRLVVNFHFYNPTTVIYRSIYDSTKIAAAATTTT